MKKKTENFKRVDVPPGDGLVGKYIGLWRKEELYIGKVLRAWKWGQKHFVIYMLLSGCEKGSKWQAKYWPSKVYAFEKERECRKHYRNQLV
jgi:hypothetical protein